MAKSPVHPRRRRFIKLTATGLVVAPLATALLRGNASAADLIKESDPAAVKLKYKADATKAPSARTRRSSATTACSTRARTAPMALALCSRTSSSLPRAGALHGAADTPGRNDMHLTE